MLSLILNGAAFAAEFIAAWLFLDFLIVTAWHLTRQARQRQRYHRDHQAGVAAGGRDTLDALIDASREKPHESYAWEPGSDEPVPYLPVDPIRVPEDCGCIRWSTGRRGRITPVFEQCPAHEAMAGVERTARQQAEGSGL